jgi:etoposide-induced 2.4 mRNA
VEYFETHWAYFLGFGLPFTALTYFFTPLVSAATFALLFPFFVIIATSAKPVAYDDSTLLSVLLPARIQLCWPARPLTHRILMRILPPQTLSFQPRPPP